MRSVVAAMALLAAGAPGALGADVTAISLKYICGAESQATADVGARRLEIVPGVGTGGFAIRTTSPDAQRWFNFGVTLFHAFYHDDAKLAFDKAVAADPACALCLWGQALAHGPTQNFDIDAPETKVAAGYARKALDAARTPQEQVLAKAMVARYAAKQDPRAEIDFANALLRAAALDPANLDLALIASEALLAAQRRGDSHSADRAIALLQPILATDPDNTAAIHYYIHATEFVGKAALAEPYADRLAALAPKASHLIHMAAHTYLHVGRYEDAAALNAHALSVDTDWSHATGAAGPLGAPPYYPHNLGFGLAGALMAGDGPLALKFADHAPLALPDAFRAGMGINTIARSYVAYGRFDPDRALSLPQPAAGNIYRLAMWRYARGEAYAAKGDARGVLEESRQIGVGMGPKPDLHDFNLSQAEIARRVLEGRAAMIQGQPDAAAKIFKDAAAFQERFSWGMDPPPWWYPVRRSLAAADLKAGRNADAVREASASLAAWPGDGLALSVLATAEQRLGKDDAARKHLEDARRAWRGDPAKTPLDLI